MPDPWERHARDSKYDWSWENVPSRRQARNAAIADQDEHDPDQAWFWTPEWQEGERQAAEDIEAGCVSEVFYSAEEFFRHLDRPDEYRGGPEA